MVTVCSYRRSTALPSMHMISLATLSTLAHRLHIVLKEVARNPRLVIVLRFTAVH